MLLQMVNRLDFTGMIVVEFKVLFCFTLQNWKWPRGTKIWITDATSQKRKWPIIFYQKPEIDKFYSACDIEKSENFSLHKMATWA